MQLLPLLVFIVLSLGTVASGAKVLLLPFDHKAHVNAFSVTGRHLQDNGHDVLLLTTERNRHIVEKIGIPAIFHKPINSHSPTENYSDLEDSFFSSGIGKVWRVGQFYKSLATAFFEYCREVATNEDTMGVLRAHKFDIALVDGGPIAQCLFVLAYKLNLPYVTLSPQHDPWNAGIPAMPSSEGVLGIVWMPRDPSFGLRMKNLVAYVFAQVLLPRLILKSDDTIRELAPEMPATTYRELFKASEVFFVNTDNTCVDIPRLEAPHYHFIGSTGASPPRPLAEPFAEYVDNAEHGIIVVSFGSLLKRVPDEMMLRMMPAFGRLQQRIIMRFDGDFQNVPDNVLLTKWLPQNDLLGHPKVRLFIAHGGLNGQMESMFHGVPTIIMPFSADQDYNGLRAHDKSFGIMLETATFTSDELHTAILEIIDNPQYAQNVQKCSRITKSFPSAHETIRFWIEHVLEFGGGGHLKPLSVDMPLWKLFMLDVLGFLLLVNVALCYAAYRCCATCCCRRKQQKDKVA